MKTIAVYGSLKQFKYNHDMISGSTFLGKTRMSGVMWLISTYPAFVESEGEREGEREHRFELYEVEDKVYEAVRAMEIGAGYDEVEKDFALKDNKVVKAVYYPASKSLREYCEKNRQVIADY